MWHRPIICKNYITLCKKRINAEEPKCVQALIISLSIYGVKPELRAMEEEA